MGNRNNCIGQRAFYATDVISVCIYANNIYSNSAEMLIPRGNYVCYGWCIISPLNPENKVPLL